STPALIRGPETGGPHGSLRGHAPRRRRGHRTAHPAALARAPRAVRVRVHPHRRRAHRLGGQPEPRRGRFHRDTALGRLLRGGRGVRIRDPAYSPYYLEWVV